MKLPRLFAAILLLGTLSACATRATPMIADSACLSFKALSYAIPPKQADGSRDVAVDAGNRYDSTLTVAEIAEHNARYEATCPRG